MKSICYSILVNRLGILFISISTIFIAGCQSSNTKLPSESVEDCSNNGVIVNGSCKCNTYFFGDFCENEIPDFSAPKIVSVSLDPGGSKDAFRNYIQVYWKMVKNTIGYKLYYSENVNGPYLVVKSGSTYEYPYNGSARKSGIYFDKEGLYFFKVAAINEKGEESGLSDSRGILWEK